MSRPTLLKLWLLCLAVTPVLLIAQLIHSLVGSRGRAYTMAVALDEVGNAMLGGSHNETISTRVGNALLLSKPWAKPAAKFIDTLFGKGHCLSKATLSPNLGATVTIGEVAKSVEPS